MKEQFSKASLNHKKVSIIVPIHGYTPVFEKCLDAIEKALGNHGENSEVTVVLDRADKRAKNIAAKKNCTVLELDNNKKGAGAARNLGIHRSKNEYLLFVDSDIIIRKNTLSILFDSMAKDPARIAVCAIYSPRDSEGTRTSAYRTLQEHIWYKNTSGKASAILPLACALVKKNALLTVGELSEKGDSSDVEDWDLGQRLCQNGIIWIEKKAQVDHYSIHRLDILLKKVFTRSRMGGSYALIKPGLKGYINNQRIVGSGFALLILFQLCLLILLPIIRVKNRIMLGKNLLISILSWSFLNRDFIYSIKRRKIGDFSTMFALHLLTTGTMGAGGIIGIWDRIWNESMKLPAQERRIQTKNAGP